MRGTAVVTMLAVLFFLSEPANAGIRKDWEPQGLISMRVYRVQDKGFPNPAGEKSKYTGDVLEIKVAPATGKYRSGNLELRIDGIVISKFNGSPYRKVIPLGWPVVPDKEVGVVPGQDNPQPLQLNDGSDYVVEAYFTVRDPRSGKEVSSKSAAPTATFSKAAKTISPLEAAKQIQAAIEQATKQLRENYEAEMKKWQAEVDKLKQEKKAQQECYEKQLEEAKKPQATTAVAPVRKVVLSVDGKPIDGTAVNFSTVNEVWLEVKGADRYLVFAEGKDRSFKQETPLSISINKGYSGKVRIIAFVGEQATEYQITAKGVDAQ